EVWAQRFNEASSFYDKAAPLLDRSEDHALKGAFHNEYGLVFRQLAAPENREDYLDRALMEYTAASFHFELAGNARFLSRVENDHFNVRLKLRRRWAIWKVQGALNSASLKSCLARRRRRSWFRSINPPLKCCGNPRTRQPAGA